MLIRIWKWGTLVYLELRCRLRLLWICLQCWRPGFDPWVRKISWRKEWLPTPVFLSGEFRRQRSLVGYSPWSHKESDMTEWLERYSILFTDTSLHVIRIHVFNTWKAADKYSVQFSSVAHLCPTLCDPMVCSPPGFSVHGICQTRILEWVAIPFSRGSSQPRDQARVSWITDRFFTIWATREA